MIYPDLIEEKIRWYLWRKFTKEIFSDDSCTSEIVFQKHMLNKLAMIPDSLKLEINSWYQDTENLSSDNDLRRRVFQFYGLEAYLERPNCPPLEVLFLDIDASAWSNHSHFR